MPTLTTNKLRGLVVCNEWSYEFNFQTWASTSLQPPNNTCCGWVLTSCVFVHGPLEHPAVYYIWYCHHRVGCPFCDKES